MAKVYGIYGDNKCKREVVPMANIGVVEFEIQHTINGQFVASADLYQIFDPNEVDAAINGKLSVLAVQMIYNKGDGFISRSLQAERASIVTRQNNASDFDSLDVRVMYNGNLQLRGKLNQVGIGLLPFNIVVMVMIHESSDIIVTV